MNRRASDPGSGVINSVWLMLAANLIVSPLYAHPTMPEVNTGIKGQVLLGPTAPGPTYAGRSDEAPFGTSFYVLDAENKRITRFKSDENGCFTVRLPPGEYTVVPDKSAPIPYPGRQRKTVTVPADGYADVTFRFDSGMR